ncbi:MAG: serine/threonine protein kinase, partial [Planctomycetales bacterium]|nr:serine/threonine protein kinase [Planctomycetales bacterium]
MIGEPSRVTLVSPLENWRRIDALCDGFETAWQAGRQPRIEDYLSELSEADRSDLLRELLRIEFEYRRSDGEPIIATEYQSRFPHDSNVLTELLVESTLGNWPNSSAGKEPLGKLPQVPDYEVLGELGRGGMGVVYKARQVRLNRTVALKMILDSAHVNDESLARFQREAEAVAQVQHPNIVQIYEIGDHDGLPFFSLEFVDGGSLDRLVSGEPFPLRDVAGLVETIARAMHFAHEHGIIHRDLKPANILLARSTTAHALPASTASTKPSAQAELSTVPEQPHGVSGDSITARPDSRPSLADFVPKITDFGLAKKLEGDAAATLSGAVMGTPSYMAPEQAAGRTHEIGPLADVYALGAILYNLLTGRPPFRAESVVDTLRLVIDSDPISPRLLDPTLDRDLETICLKCLEKDPQRRYPSALDLASELLRYRTGMPIEARPISAPARAWRYCKRRPLVSSFAALFILSMLVGISVSRFFAVLANNRATLLQSNNTKLKDANETSEKRRIAAEEATAVARGQSQLALKSLESVIFDIQRKLDNVPGAGNLQRSLLQTALARLQEVSDQFASRSAIDRNTVTALVDLGDVFLRIGAATSGGAHADGSLTAARKVYRQAFDIAQKLAAANPSVAQAQSDLSLSYNRLGDVQLRSGQVTEALGSYEKGLAISQKLAAADPSDAQAQRDLSISYEKLGDVQLQSGQVTEALGSYEKGLAISQ